MEKKKKLVPKLRFKEFLDAGDWEQRKLGCLIDELKSGLSRMLSEEDIGVPVVRANNINNEHLDLTKDIKYWFLDDPKGVDISNYLIHEKDVLINFINSESKMGSCAIVEKEPNRATIYTTNILRMKLNEDKCDNHFFLAKSLTKEYKDYIKGISKIAVNQASFTTVDFKNFDISLPSVGEQRKIGFFFQQLDNLITLHQRKVDKLQQVKKAHLCEMFPENGKTKPKRRFKCFTDDWEQRKSVDIADYSKGNGYSKSDLTENGTPIILYGRLYTKYQFAIAEVDTFATPKDGSIYSQGNEVIIPASGETAEDIARASAVEKSGILLGGDLNILRPFNFINPLFLALTISNGEPQKELAKKAQGKSVVHIHNSDIQEVTVSFPTRAEQDRIVAVFRSLDNLITLHQRKVEKLKKLKESYLNDMFV